MGEGKEGPEGEIQQRQNQPSAPQAKTGVGASTARQLGLEQILLLPPTETNLHPSNSLLRAWEWSCNPYVKSDKSHYY